MTIDDMTRIKGDLGVLEDRMIENINWAEQLKQEGNYDTYEDVVLKIDEDYKKYQQTIKGCKNLWDYESPVKDRIENFYKTNDLIQMINEDRHNYS